ncbi:UDP-N-acetylglucosamine 2-epimerase [Lysobacter sp. S4-A87]|uniref:UDP-N-acetylglucosamine 2-epimerase n=1 Tax=Lysobacter sp. S4-A87 TaxID=2925843 RepID=UPI001F530EE0|nr:UDP-N-acetylglucosamine 2-epimerase [Lysobacter sp. S4-A87]UNK49942.1 UDP-N-acetylglucosamine 2-epimerase [Lysobacter sp. S4-A87]
MKDPKLVAASAIALAVTLFAIFSMRPWARRMGLVDKPNGRKHHRGHIPLIGGLCFFIGTVVGLSYLGYFDGFVTSLMAASALIVVAGALDDASDLSVRARLIVEAGAAGLVIAMSGYYVHDLGHLIGDDRLGLGMLGIPFTIIAVIGLINAFNMLDGIDGLAATVAMVSIGAIMLFDDSPWSMPGVVFLLQVLFFALIPYLFVNLGWPDGRKIFMGDAGSTLIGFLLAWSLIYMSHERIERLAAVDVLWCVALPVLDTAAVMYRRMRMGRSPFRADRQHLHHLLLDAGLRPREALLAMLALSGLLVFVGYALRNAPEALSLAAFFAVLAAHVWGTPVALKRIRLMWPSSLPGNGVGLVMAFSGSDHEPTFITELARFEDGLLDDHPRDPDQAHADRGRVAPERESPVQAAPGMAPVKTLCVLADSPDAVHIAPIAQTLARDDRFDSTVCVTSVPERNPTQVMSLFDLVADVELDVPHGEDPAETTSNALGSLQRVMSDLQPDLVLVPGDTPATLAATLAAHYRHVPVVCVDSGLAGTGIVANDDPGRRIARSLAALHVAPSTTTGRQLVAEGVPAERVLVAGNTAIDTLRAALSHLRWDGDRRTDLRQRYAFLRRGHPLLLMLGGSVSADQAGMVAAALQDVAQERPDVDVVCADLSCMEVASDLALPNMHWIEQPDYLASVYLLERAHLAFVHRDIEVEAMAMAVPLLALQACRDVQGNGRVHLLGTDPESICNNLLHLLSREQPLVAPAVAAGGLDEGDACLRIADALAVLRPAAPITRILSQDAGSPNHAGMSGAWEAS